VGSPALAPTEVDPVVRSPALAPTEVVDPHEKNRLSRLLSKLLERDEAM
jgi:hypothetical protein